MNKATLGHLLLLNVSILLISTSGVLGRSIALDPKTVIFYRSAVAALLFAVYFLGKRQAVVFTRFPSLANCIAGCLMAVHWVTYFYALQWSNVAIGMLSLFTYPVITAVLEPLFFEVKYSTVRLLLAGMMLFGIYLLVPEFELENQQFKAVGIGVFSALCYATRNLVLKKSIHRESGMNMMFYQVVIVVLLLFPFAQQTAYQAVLEEWKSLLLLAFFTTVLGHSLFLQSLKFFSVTRASLISCAQPIYGIVLAGILLHELPEMKTLLGGGVILLAVAIEIQTHKN